MSLSVNHNLPISEGKRLALVRIEDPEHAPCHSISHTSGNDICNYGFNKIA